MLHLRMYVYPVGARMHLTVLIYGDRRTPTYTAFQSNLSIHVLYRNNINIQGGLQA